MRFVFSDKPKIIYWEITRACDLACKHCRAEAINYRNPLELSTGGIFKTLEKLKGFGEPLPLIVFTGGDIMFREDVFDIVYYARKLGFNISVSPSGTSRLRKEHLRVFKELGVSAISLSLDGSNAEKHDSFRGVKGCFDETMRIIEEVNETKIPLQINTLVCEETYGDIENIYNLIKGFNIIRWSVFFLVNVGRGSVLKQISPSKAERLLNNLYEWSKEANFIIKTTEALHYRRVFYKRWISEGKDENSLFNTPTGKGFGIRDGNGIMFISHIGNVYPSGFLPLSSGNVRREDPVSLYRNSWIFNALRNPDMFRGKCGVCEFRYICGGSRARAYTIAKNPLDSEPLCPYIPRGGKVIC